MVIEEYQWDPEWWHLEELDEYQAFYYSHNPTFVKEWTFRFDIARQRYQLDLKTFQHFDDDEYGDLTYIFTQREVEDQVGIRNTEEFVNKFLNMHFGTQYQYRRWNWLLE